jgi:predicted phage tail protein
MCEGEIKGYATGTAETSVFLNDVPVQTPQGVDNFAKDAIKIVRRKGKNDQSSLKRFSDVRIEQSVGVKTTKKGGPAVVTTSHKDLDALIVRVGVSALYQVDEETGDVSGSELDFNIKIIDFLGTVRHDEDKKINGKSRGSVDFEYEFALSGEGPWTVRVTRKTDDPENIRQVDDFFFKAIVGILDESFRYPNTALVGVTLNAEGFSSIPSLSVELKGLKIQVPSIYNPDDRTYRGVWDGTLSEPKYCNNPAWVFYDLLTNERYGCGQFVKEDDVDLFALLQIGKYCDELVDDGRGGKEPRFTFNGNINNRGEAYEVLNSLAAAFRGMLYYSNGQIVATQDRPGSVVRTFNASNVIQEVDDAGEVTAPLFQYEGTGRKARKTVALVSWNDPEDRYRTKLEYVEDRKAVETLGYRELEVRAFGCTSQGQAQRIGRWALVTNLTEKETVTFKVSADGFFLLPGELIEIADEAKTAKIIAGRVESGSTTSRVNVDTPLSFDNGVAYEITIGDETRNIRENASISASAVLVSTDFTTAPSAGDLFLIRQVNGAKPRTYRVVGLSENEDSTVTVTAAVHNKDKFDIVDSSTFFDAQVRSVAGVNVVLQVSVGTIRLDVT